MSQITLVSVLLVVMMMVMNVRFFNGNYDGYRRFVVKLF